MKRFSTLFLAVAALMLPVSATAAQITQKDKALSQKRAYEIALEGLVLLKNEDGILPLKPGRKNILALIGPNANEIVCGDRGKGANVLYVEKPRLETGQMLLPYPCRCIFRRYSS